MAEIYPATQHKHIQLIKQKALKISVDKYNELLARVLTPE